MNSVTRSISTTRLGVLFDYNAPDLIVQLQFKDYHPTATITAYNLTTAEFWGQSMRNTSTAGFLQPLAMVSEDWVVTQSTPTFAEVLTTSESANQPVVTTRYRFFADLPFFTVDRTIRFSTHPDTSAYQAYLPRMAEIYPYRAIRWRDPSGTLIQRGFCATPCIDTNWDGRWLELVQLEGSNGFAIASIFPASMPGGTRIVRGQGTNSPSVWGAPLVPAGTHDTDVTSSLMVAFSSTPDHVTTFDSLWTVYNGGGFAVDVPVESAASGLTLSVAPNPSRGESVVDWVSPWAGPFTLEVLDVAGRRVATLAAGWAAAGRRSAHWDGRDASGRTAGPGLYFVRLVAPGGARVSRVVRTN